MVLGNELITNKPAEANISTTQEWMFSTPEQQGMDSAKLVEMVEDYKKKHLKNNKIMIDSITIIRNDHIVADIYLNPLFPKDTKHIIHSCTKSVMSILIGIAIEQGCIQDINVRILDIFYDKRPKQVDNRLKTLSLEDLLTMQTGLHSQDSYLYEWRGLFKMMNTDDWVEHILNLPMEVKPGQRFDYSNMSSFLLSAIIAKTTGMDTFSFARKYLFDPLGIKDIQWEQSPQGIHIGWARLRLKPHDMAKLGMLYLQKGKWDKQQVVPAHWVDKSTTAHSFPKKYRYVYKEDGKVDYIASGGVWIFTNLLRPFSDAYGYQWWLDKSGMYAAIGVGGQYIMVVPHENLIAVFTSKLSAADSFIPPKMLKKFILPSIVSNASIPDNRADQKNLAELAEPPQLGTNPKPVPSLPPIALEISGNTYSLEGNPWGYDNFQLSFNPQENYVVFDYSAKDKVFHIDVGLDDVYRITESNDNSYAAKGYWIASDTFIIDYEIIGYSTKGKWTLTFTDNELAVEEVGVTGIYTYTGKKVK